MPGLALAAADGAEFHAVIEEMTDGTWRASGVVRLDKKSAVLEQTSGIEMCPRKKRLERGSIVPVLHAAFGPANFRSSGSRPGEPDDDD